ncbi:hypothetical protein BCR36DRAFT_416187 [Piromyces finnis]|uniref:Uncharacterized protein n=1 Tax=Piromyces finnis TaxID=1754191 RepID=A0A1Y1UW91_9FUNG|nr:hypothetical protein BCR36DRAFT_416187 [Piromyces finnis]|eukprot:ORX42306.1 hypothetical protein BCR36DRAFT_416187 [Piromyces finnis]
MYLKEVHKILSNEYKIIINNECFSFFEGISIINCNNLTKDQYTINDSNNNINDYLNNFLLINSLEKICNEKVFKYNFDLKDITKTKFYISINIPSYTLKDIYNEIIRLELPSTCQYVTAFIKRISYLHYFNKRYTETYQYNQVLIAKDKSKDIKDSDNFIIIKCCHDSVRITGNKITFYERDTYDNIICKLLPCLNYSSDQILIRFEPSIVSFTYPININFQLFDLMLYENALYPYIYTNENEDIIKNKEKLVYTINIFNQSLNMKLYNKYKQFTEIIQFQELEWYMYMTVNKILKYLYLLYIDFHVSYYNRNKVLNIPLKINYNRLFGKYYTRYFNNKVLPVIADKEEYIKNNIPYVQWNNNYYRSPENSGYKIILSANKNSTDNNFVFHVKKLLFDSESESKMWFLYVLKKISFQFIYTYGYELQGLYRQYFDIPEINNKFIICSKCNKYINIPSQQELINCVKEKFNNKQLNLINENYNDINILSFSVDNNMNIYLYCVFDYVYNYNSSFPFLIIMLYTYNVTLTKYTKQYISDNKTVLITEKEFPDEKVYLWRSIYSEIIPTIPIIKDNDELYNTLPSFSFLCKNIKNITAYHYNIMNEYNKKVIIYGVWVNEDYYPCKASIEILKSTILNKPYY